MTPGNKKARTGRASGFEGVRGYMSYTTANRPMMQTTVITVAAIMA